MFKDESSSDQLQVENRLDGANWFSQDWHSTIRIRPNLKLAANQRFVRKVFETPQLQQRRQRQQRRARRKTPPWVTPSWVGNTARSLISFRHLRRFHLRRFLDVYPNFPIYSSYNSGRYFSISHCVTLVLYSSHSTFFDVRKLLNT